MKIIYTILLSVLLLCSCVESAEWEARKMICKNKKWELLKIQGSNPDSGLLKRPVMEFDPAKKNVIIHAACNEFSCKYLWDNKFTQFGSITSTTKACDSLTSLWDNKIYVALQNAFYSRPAGNNIEILNSDKKVVLLLGPL